MLHINQILIGIVCATILSAPLQAQTAPQDGGVLRVVVNPEPPGLVTGLVTNAPTQMVGGGIFESLVRFTPNLEAIPALAKSWTIDETGTVYTFTLQPDALWHDGTPFTADDVVFSLDTFLREVNPRWRVILEEHVVSIAKQDDHNVVITLKHIFDPLLMTFDNGAMPILPRHIYEGTDYASNPMNNTPVGTGPMKFKEWVRGSHVELVRNEDYYVPGLPRLDGAIYRFIPDAASRAIAFETGEVDVMTGGSLDYADVHRLAETPNTCVTTEGWELFAPQSYFQLNVTGGPLANKTFRKGLMHAIDQDFIRDVVWAGYGEIGTGPISPRTRFYPETVEPTYDFNPERARELIAEAGYAGETLRYLVVPYGETWTRLAEVTRQFLTDVGVEVELVTTDTAGWNLRARDGDYDITNNWPYQYGDPSLGVSRMWVSSTIGAGNPFSNTGGYSNPEVDRLFEEGALATPEDRAKIFQELHNLLADDLPALWSIDLAFPTVFRCHVHDFITTATGPNDALLSAWIEQ